jgi:hypothetical protein
MTRTLIKGTLTVDDGQDLISNTSEIQTERDRTLFELVRRTSESARAYRTDLSRRLRDGVSLENELLSSRMASAAPKSASVVDGLRFQG